MSLMAEVKEVSSRGLSYCVKDGSHYTWVSTVQDIQENAGDKHMEEEVRLEGNKRKNCGKLWEDMYHPDWFEGTSEDDEEVTAMSSKGRRKSKRKKTEECYSENINIKKENGRGKKTSVNSKELPKKGIENEREKLNPGEMSPITAMCNRILKGVGARVPTKRNIEEVTGSCPLCDKEMVISLLENHAAVCRL